MFCHRLLGSGYERFGGPGGFGGGMFIMMGFGFLVFLALIFIAYKLMKGHQHHSQLSSPSNFENNAAIIILNERFAKGEINEEEYTKRKMILNQK